VTEPLKPVRWVGSALRELREFPAAVRSDIGQALWAQVGKTTDPTAKPLRGFGGVSVMEIVASHHGNAWRVVYTARFRDAIMFCTCFRRNRRKASLHDARKSN
jgi:phage-related protein